MIGLARIDLGEKHDPAHVFSETVEHHPLLGPQDHHFHRCMTEGCCWTSWGPRWEHYDRDEHHDSHLVELP